MSKPRIGIVGTGKMGLPMATNLLNAGYEVIAFNRSTESLAELESRGGQRADSLSDIAATADIVLSSLTNQQSVRDVYLGPDGLATHARRGQIFIETSTNDLELVISIDAALGTRGASLLDSPVSGGVPGAVAGSLTVMTGGDERVYNTCKPILDVIGGNVHHLGPVGAGTAMKLVNQLLVGIHTAAVAEALVLGANAGASPEKILEVIATSFGGSRMLDRNIPLTISRNFAPATPVDLIRKDLGIIIDQADSNGLPLNVAREALALYNRSHDDGLGENDMTAIIVPLEQDTGTTVS